MRRAAWISLVFLAPTAYCGPGVQYASFKHGGALYHEIVADLNNESVSAETRYAPRLTSIRNIWGDDPPVGAITGTFFAWENERPVAEVVVDGELQCPGRRGSVFAIDWFGKAHIFHPGYRQEFDWFPYRFAVRGTVRILEDGKINPDPRSQKFKDSAIWGSAARTAVGTTPGGKLVMLATRNSVKLSDLGRAMKSQGVSDAVCLDGGGSTALFYRGSMVVPCHRPLCNILVVYERSPFDTTYRTHLAKVARYQSEKALKSIGRKGK